MAKQLTKEEFIEVAKEFGYDTDGEYSNYVAIYLNNEIAADNLIAWLDAETKRDGCYDIRLDCMGAICTRGNGRTLASKEAFKNYLKRIEKDILFWKKQYKLRLIKSIGQDE
ncbi:MAG: hypothetical protein ACI4V7_04210 [Succinivibrionaceae bacterium]